MKLTRSMIGARREILQYVYCFVETVNIGGVQITIRSIYIHLNASKIACFDPEMNRNNMYSSFVGAF